MLHVAPSAFGLNHPSQDVTLDGDRPGRLYMHRGSQELHRQPATEVDPGFTDWLGKTLHDTYDAVTQEPLPRDLAVLIRHLEQLQAPDA